MSNKGKVLVAMSGGIDSSLTAMLLHEEGYQVVGVTMKTWDFADSCSSKSGKETGCCNLDSFNDAREVAVRAGFSHFVVDIREQFEQHVVSDFISEYQAGRTPNPCIRCNTHIKWDALLQKANALGCEYIATGHYANVHSTQGRYYVSRGQDMQKDQSYVLWGLSQESLSRTLFPLAKYQKDEIRQMAIDLGFKNLVDKSESYEICFIPDNDYRAFIAKRTDTSEMQDGRFVTADGVEVGKHNGYQNYTIGQRKGVVAMGKPYYVTRIVPETNTITIGQVDELYKGSLKVSSVNMMKYAKVPEGGIESLCMIRAHDPGTMSKINQANNEITAVFSEPVKAVSPGQAAVFYEGNDVIAGGWIV